VTVLFMLIAIVLLYCYQYFEGMTEGDSQPGADHKDSDSRYHAERTIQIAAIICGFAAAALAGATWLHLAALLSALVGSNALYNRRLVYQAQGSWVDINRGFDGTPATFSFLEIVVDIKSFTFKVKPFDYKYPWWATGRGELFFTLPVFTALSILFAVVR
jgi:hypothetical protein